MVPSVISQHVGGEDDRTMDWDSVGGVGRGTRALGRSGAHMSNAVAVLLIFATFAVALSAVRRSSSPATATWQTDGNDSGSRAPRFSVGAQSAALHIWSRRQP